VIDERYRPVAIVDDDAAVLESFEFLLEMAGFQVAAYRSAQAFLQGGPIPTSCLIVDQHMPGMTGLELAAKLRDDGVEVPVMLVTSAPSPAIYAKAREIGLRGVMEKPMREDEVIAFIRSCEG
jgi:two-component system, LuxR family, response regulator FixJ